MRIAKVIGTVTHSAVYDTLVGGRFVLLAVQDRFSLAGAKRRSAETVVAYDNLGVGQNDTVCFTESREATMPFYPEKLVPIDAFVTAILDEVVIEEVQYGHVPT